MADRLRQERLDSARRVREIRQNMGVSQEKFAEYLDLSLSAYKKIESAENGVSVNVLRRLRDKFGVSSDYVLYGSYKNPEDIFVFLQNCSEPDKMDILLRLAAYFANDKKKVFVELEKFYKDKT